VFIGGRASARSFGVNRTVGGLYKTVQRAAFMSTITQECRNDKVIVMTALGRRDRITY
jgi:hypothetical protein